MMFPPPQDYLTLIFAARCDPLAEGDAGLVPFFASLEAHAGEWMPQKVGGRRRRNYSRVVAVQELKSDVGPLGNRGLSLLRGSPDMDLSLSIEGVPWPSQFHVAGRISPLSLVEDRARSERWSRDFIALFRAWSSSYPVAYAFAHPYADWGLAGWKYAGKDAPEEMPRDMMKAVHWLNVFGKPWVDALGRERVLSTPGYLVEELPTGAVLLVTRPTLADWRAEAGRLAQARALVHLRPELEFETVLRELRERSALFDPIEPRFDPDLAPLLMSVANYREIAERSGKIAELNAYRPPEVDEWLPANASLPSDVVNPEASLDEYLGWADDLSIMLHPDVADYFEASPDALMAIDWRLWREKFPEFYEREKIDRQLFPAMGAYLGHMLVRHLGGRWVPRRNLLESQVLVGDRAWLPFLRAQHCLKSTQSVLDYSLTKFYRMAERHARRPHPS